MSLDEAMLTQRVIRRLRDDPVDDVLGAAPDRANAHELRRSDSREVTFARVIESDL